MSELWFYFYKCRRYTFPVAFLVVVSSLLRVIHALLNTFIYNALFHLQMKEFLKYLFIDLGVFSLLAGLLIFLQIKKTKAVEEMTKALRLDIMGQLSQKSLLQFQKENTGTYASWLTNDMTIISQNGFASTFGLIQILTDPLFAIVTLFFLHWSFIPVVLFLSLVTVGLPQLLRKKLATTQLLTTQKNEKLLSAIHDFLKGFPTLLLYRKEQELERKITPFIKDVLKSKVHQAKYQSLTSNLAGFFNIVGQLAIQGWTGFLAIQHLIPLGVIASSTNLSFHVFNSMAIFSPLLAEMKALQVIFEKYHLKDPKKTEEKLLPFPSAEKPLIQLINTSYSYQDVLTLKPLSVTIYPSQKIAITGDSGAGKSTLLKILSGQLTDYRGNIAINHQELKHLQAKELRQHILYVEQTPYLFHETFRYNLTLGDAFSDEELYDALKKVGLADFVLKQINQLDTSIEESGQSLSGGQKQRLALARGLLRKPEVLLLDEVTNSLEKKQALEIENLFLSLTDTTVLFVTHQLHEENKERFNQIIQL